jgi:hypothetical protein
MDKKPFQGHTMVIAELPDGIEPNGRENS